MVDESCLVNLIEIQKGILEMGEFGDGWSWEENKLFEVALAVVDEEKPDRWEVVAAIVGGKKSAVDVHTHYVILLQDLECIESGKLDHKLIDDYADQFLDSSTESSCCTDEEDHNFLVYLNLYDYCSVALKDYS